MNIPDKIRKLLESEDVGDIIIGLQLFCKAVDNEEFNKFINNLSTYKNILIRIRVSYRGGYYFKYKGQCFLASNLTQTIFKVIDSHINKILYEYEYNR